MYKEWAEGQIAKQNAILNAARENHSSAVKSRIEDVQQMGSVVDVTKQLFDVSKVRYHNESNTRRMKMLTNTRRRLLSKRRLLS